MTAGAAIAISGCVAGVLDLTATGTAMRAQRMPLERLLQFIASGALGSSAFEAGKRTAGLGLLFHFVIALGWAAIYYAAGLRWPILLERPVLGGVGFGIVVHLVMSRVVLPLSRTAKRPFAMKAFVTQLVIHIVFAGLPIAEMQSWLRG